MIDKFFDEFDKFTSYDKIPDLSDEAVVLLFGIYCQLRQSKAAPAPAPQVQVQPSESKSTTIRRPNNAATFKQKKLISRLISQGQLNNIDVDELTVSMASALIEQGIKAPKKFKSSTASTASTQIKVEVPDKEEPEFIGAYSHQSSDLESENLF